MRHRKSKALLIGNYAIEKTGIARFDWHDAYYNVVTMSWPRFLLSFAALFVVLNLVFGCLYLIRPGSLANAHPGSLSDALFFSLQTATTVGYGDIYPANLYSRIVAGAEMMVGFSFTALTTGLLFVRFSRPKARIGYAKNAVIANASAHLGLIRTSHGPAGEPLRQVHELPLLRSRLPLFSLIWTLMHRIDTASPLHGYDAARLIEDNVHLFVSFEGHDATLAATVVDTQDYGADEILYGMRYVGTISANAEGHPTADLGQLSAIEPDIGGEPPQTGWIDAK